MTERNTPKTRDEVLFAFHEECTRPTVDQIIEWTEKYPQFAEDIRAHAAIARDWAARKSDAREVPEASLLATAFSQTLNLIFDADHAPVQEKPRSEARSFQQHLSAKKLDTPALARIVDIDRGVVADLVSGRMLPPVGKRLVEAVSTCLSITRSEFDTALDLARAAPATGHAKAAKAPTVIAQSYETIIRGSGMDEERQRYWLSDD